MRGSVVKCVTRNLDAPGLNHTKSFGFFVGVSLGNTSRSPSLVHVEPRK